MKTPIITAALFCASLAASNGSVADSDTYSALSPAFTSYYAGLQAGNALFNNGGGSASNSSYSQQDYGNNSNSYDYAETVYEAYSDNVDDESAEDCDCGCDCSQ